MSPLTEPTRLTLAKSYIGTDDADAAAYIAAVEAADGQALETATRVAIHSFVKGCKADGIWPAIKASCILAGARTLSGALVPLVGTAPTNFNFVSGDYNRKTGLVGNGSTKYLSTVNATIAPQDSFAMYAYQTAAATRTATRVILGCTVGNSDIIATTATGRLYRSRNNGTAEVADLTNINGGIGINRANSSQSTYRYNGVSNTRSETSSAANNFPIQVFARNADLFSDARLSFYSLSESLDLAKLDARVTDLINAFGAAIP